MSEKEKITIGLEKIFFNHILENPNQFERVEPYFFQNDDIQFIYTVVRDEFLRDKHHEVPSHQQILQMVKLNDKDDKITNDIIKMLLKTDMSKYEENWLHPKFQAWKVSNQIRNNTMMAIDYIRSIDDLNYENVTTVLGKMQQLYNNIQYLDESEDMGADFDDFEAHQVTSATKKIPTGWPTLDTIMGGGWDHASLNLIMGETNIGKCATGDTKIKIRNKISGEILYITYEEFYNKVKFTDI